MKSIQICLFAIFVLCCGAVLLSGCSVTFTESETLHFTLTESTVETLSVIADFEAGETENVAGDVTQQSGSVCAGGACIIY